MNNKVVSFVMFAAGAVIGSAVAWKLTKNKYEQIMEEEIATMREAYRKKTKEKEEDSEESEEAHVKRFESKTFEPRRFEFDKVVVDEYKNTIDELEYADISEKGELEMREAPYVISPDEFNERDDYETQSLVYYQDGVLTDDLGNVIHDIDDIVGLESLEHFGEYADNVVFVRNDHLGIDYEIMLHPQEYAIACREDPFLATDVNDM